MTRVGLAALLMLAAVPPTASATGPGRVVEPTDARAAAVGRLAAALGPGGRVALDRMTATPRTVAKLDGFLTRPSPAAATDVALGYVRDHPNLFGLSAAEIAALKLTKAYTDVLGTTHLVWAQAVDGVPAVDNGIRAAVARDGRLVQIGGSPLPGLSVTTVPKLTAAQALQAARDDAGAAGVRPAVVKVGSGARRATEFEGDNAANLAIYTNAGGPRLVWRVLADKSPTELYDSIVDAKSGEVLDRENTVKFATGLAWDYFPSPLARNGSGVETSRDFTAKGWLPSDPTALSGNNTHTYVDSMDADAALPGEEVGPSSDGNWNDHFAPHGGSERCSDDFPCSWNTWGYGWFDNARHDAIQLFHFVNTFHDYLQNTPTIAFTEAAGNFQMTNASGHGRGGDAVQAEALNGADTETNLPEPGFPDENHFNKSDMTTRADGEPPRMQMYLMSGMAGTGGNVNGGDDASIVYHEYTHGLSSRLVTDDDGNPALAGRQAGAMGEGWSDWYAMDFLVNHGYDVDTADVGDVRVGFYVTHGSGLRTQPMDCPVAVTAAPCTNAGAAGDGGYTYGDFGKVAGAPEVHADGEIWGQTLWELRRRLVAKHGEAGGDARVQTYITRGMELTPPFPSMIDARNGILQAETVATAAGGPFAGSDDDDVLWQTFAGRGMGYFAAAVDGDDAEPVASFALPPAPGAPKGSLTGTVTMQDGGAPAAGVRVEIGGHAPTTTASNGRYTISGVPNGTYPYVFAGGNGYDRVQFGDIVISGTTTKNFTVRRNWAERGGGAGVVAFTGPDRTADGCGPERAIDGAQWRGWRSSPGTPRKSVTIKLARTITLSQYAVDPGATCGDDDNASVGSYTIETSRDGTTFTQTNAGVFTAADNHRLNALTPGGGTANVRYVRFTMNKPQSTAGNGPFAMDLSELKVYGTEVVPPDVRSDFNRDGFSDLAVGVPGEDLGTATDSGMVQVLYGSASGLLATGSQVWTSDGEAGDRFGAAVAAGDFNGDGYDDLAIGAPGDAAGAVANAGSVTVLYGSAAGLTVTHSRLLTQDTTGVEGVAEAGDGFGSSLAAGDLGRTAEDDLVVGAPSENTGAGVVHALYGSPSGITAVADQIYSQGAAAGAAEAGDHFGAALAIGDLGGSTTADLAVGAPEEDVGAATDTGSVSVLYGGTSGLSATGAQTFDQNFRGVPGSNASGDRLGAALAIADLRGTTIRDLAIGVPGDDVGSNAEAGSVIVLPGSADGATVTGSSALTEDSADVPDSPEAGDRFGASLAAGDFAGTVKDDLAVGAPGESVGTKTGAGQVMVLLGTTGELSGTGSTIWNQNTPGVTESAEAEDHLGASLTAGEFDDGAKADLAIGIPDEDVWTIGNAGAVTTIYGGTSALSATGSQFLGQNTSAIGGSAEAGDGFGGALGQGG